MKTLTKLHLINWNYIEFETIDFHAEINFFVGGTGAGKSTVIDALQFLLLGNPPGNYFNQAASEKSDRKLIEYLCGMYEQNDDTKGYLRNKHSFSSFIVAEFLDENKGKRFCLGVVFDVDISKHQDHLFFFLNAPLPDHQFLNEDRKTPMTISQLRKFYKGESDNFVPYLDEAFREALVQRHLGKFGHSFFGLFKKAIALKITENIKDFILKFVCEEDIIDIEEMQETIRSYKKLEDELTRTKHKIEHLEQIKTLFVGWRTLKDQETLNNFLLGQADIESLSQKISLLKNESQTLQAEIEALNEQKSTLAERLKNTEEEKNELNRKIFSESRQEEELKEQKKNLEEKLELLRTQREEYNNKALSYFRWYGLLEEWKKTGREEVENCSAIEEGLVNFKSLTLDKEGFMELRTKLLSAQEYFRDFDNRFINEERDLKQEETRLIEQTRQLERGIKNYPDELVEVKETISRKLALKYGKEVQVHILADLLDINDKSWTRAIEGYFKQKFSLIVEPEYCLDAVKIYREMPNKFFGIYVVETAKLSMQKITANPNSLAREITTDNPYARLFVDFILGNVIKCNDVEEMNQNRVAITSDCMLYKGFAYSRLNPRHCDNQYIGQQAIAHTIERNKIRINELKVELEQLETLHSVVKKYRGLNVFEQDEIGLLISKRNNSMLIPSLEEQFAQVIVNIGKLEENTYLASLREELRNLREEEDNVKEKEKTAISLVGDKTGRMNQISQGLPLEEADKANRQTKLITDFGEEWVFSVGQPRFKEEMEKRGSPETIKNRYRQINVKLKEELDLAFERLVKRRKVFLEAFSLYWDARVENNDEYFDTLDQLKSTEIVKYQEKIAIQKAKTFKQFREDFICKMKNNIQNTELQIRDLTRAIKNSNFGKDRYEFYVSSSKDPVIRRFYDMLTDERLLNQDSLFKDSFESDYAEVIEELFAKIIDTGLSNPEDRKVLEQNIKKYTDYRTYLDFEMKVHTGTVTSSLSKTMTKNSGGETQNPFYIAVLASFAQLYQVGDRKKNQKNSNIRLIIFDEAFNKMGEDNIEATIDLMKDLGFQIIMAPDDKTALICPEVDNVLHFKNIDKKSINITPFTKEEAIAMYG